MNEQGFFSEEAEQQLPFFLLGKGRDHRSLTPDMITSEAKKILARELKKNAEGIRFGMRTDALEVLVPQFSYRGWKVVDGVTLTTQLIDPHQRERRLHIVGRAETTRSFMGMKLSKSLNLLLVNSPVGLRIVRGGLPIPGLVNRFNTILHDKLARKLNSGVFTVSDLRIEDTMSDILSVKVARRQLR